MSIDKSKLLIISGPVGVGKTSVAGELSNILVQDNVPHAFVDLDALTYTYPRSENDPFGNQLALENLKAIWQNSHKRGAQNLIVPRVIESNNQATKIAEAVGITEPILCRLSASDKTLIERVQAREIGSGLCWHEKRSLELSKTLASAKLEDFCILTDNRTISEISKDLMQRIDWCR